MKQYLSIAPILTLEMKTNVIATLCCIIFASMCIYICWWYWKLHRTYAKFPSVRLDIKYLTLLISGRIPKTVPFTSVMFEQIKQAAQKFQKEGIFVAWFFLPYLVVYNKDILKRLYTDPAIANKSRVYNLMKYALGNGLITSTEEIWKRDRKLINPFFNVGAVKRKLQIFNDVAAKLVTELERIVDEPTLDVDQILKKYTFHVLAESILEQDMHDEAHREKLDKYIHAVHDACQGAVYRAAHPWLYWSKALPFFTEGRKYLRACDYMRHFTMEILSKVKTSAVASTESRKDTSCEEENKNSITRFLLEQHLKDPNFTITDVQDHITTIIAAAHDTTSYTLLWSLYLLGLHPEVQEKAFKEIEAIEGTDITDDAIYKLRYVECIIKETLRLYSTIPIYVRKLNKDIQWGDYKIPNGTEIGFFLYMLHRSPETFPDPEKFDPERFSSNSGISNSAYMPFAEGYRSCIGKKYAMMELKVMLAHIIRRFKIETLEKIKASDVDWSVVLAPVRPLRFRFTLR